MIYAGFGPPGMQPPTSFEAEHWYPSNLPTVRPPWSTARAERKNNKKMKGTTTTTTMVLLTTTLPTPRATMSTLESATSNLSTLSAQTLQVTETSIIRTKSNMSDILGSHLEAISSEIRNTIDRVEKKEHVLNDTIDKREKESVVEDNTSITTGIFENIDIDASIDSQELQLTKGDSITTPASNETQTVETSSSLIKEIISTNSLMTTIPSTTSVSQIIDDVINETTTIPNTLLSDSQFISSTERVQKQVSNASRENLVEQKENTTVKRDCPDIFFMLDSSGNVEAQYEKQKNLIKSILNEIGEVKRRYGLMTYAGRKRQRMNIPLSLGVSRDLFIKKLEKARFLGGITATGAAIHEVTSALADVERQTVVVIITDGFSFDDVEDESTALRAIPGISVYVTGDYFPIVRITLRSIAGSSEHVISGKSAASQLAESLRC